MSYALAAVDVSTHQVVSYTAGERLPDALFPRLGDALPANVRGRTPPAAATRQLTEGDGSVICGPGGICTFIAKEGSVIWTRITGVPGWEAGQRILVRTMRGVSIDVDRQAALVFERGQRGSADLGQMSPQSAAYLAARQRRRARPRTPHIPRRARVKAPLLRLLADHAGGEVLRETVLMALYGNIDFMSARATDSARAALRKVVDDLNRQVAEHTGIPATLIPYGRRPTMGIAADVAVCDLELLEAALSLAYRRLEHGDLPGATRLAQWSVTAYTDIDTLTREVIVSSRAQDAVGRALVLSLLAHRDPPPMTVPCALAALRWFPGQREVATLVTSVAQALGHPTLAGRAAPLSRRRALDEL